MTSRSFRDWDRSSIRSIVSILYLVAVVVALVLTLRESGSAMVEAIRGISLRPLALATLLAAAHYAIVTHIWVYLVGEQVPSLSGRSRTALYLTSQVAKYLPGSVWPIVVQMEMARSLQVQRLVITRTFLAHLGLAAVSAMLVGVMTAPLLGVSQAPLLLLAGLAVVGTALLAQLRNRPQVRKLISLAGSVTLGTVLRGLALQMVAWLVIGAHIFVLAGAAGLEVEDLFLRSVGSFALAFLIGLLVIFAPAGAGAREGALVFLLAKGDPAAALAVALTSRAVLTSLDLVAFVIGSLLRRRYLRDSDRSLAT